MTRTEFISLIETLSAKERTLIKKKNAKYAKENDAFSAFRVTEKMSNGRLTIEDSIFCRLTEKIARLSQIQENPIDEETIEDTLMDIGGYTKIWLAYRQEKLNEKSIPEVRKVSVVSKKCLTSWCYLESGHQGACSSLVKD